MTQNRIKETSIQRFKTIDRLEITGVALVLQIYTLFFCGNDSVGSRLEIRTCLAYPVYDFSKN